MTPKRVLYIAKLAALIISVIIYFRSESFVLFLILTLLTTFLLIGFIKYFVKAIYALKNNHTRLAFKYVALAALMGLFLVGIAYTRYYIRTNLLCFTVVTETHERTNILTGQCVVGGYKSDSCTIEPWYYKKGCN